MTSSPNVLVRVRYYDKGSDKRGFYASEKTNDDYIYCFENGDLVRPNWVTYSFRKLLDDNGMRRIRFHDLRHSCATLLRHQGVRMEDISKWLGHSNLLTTEQVYAHYDESAKDDTLKAISNALDQKEMN